MAISASDQKTADRPIDIRLAEISDLPVLLHLQQAASETDWSETMLADSVAAGQCYLAVTAGQSIAFAVISVVLDDAELLNIAVDPECQRQGVGSFLLERVLAELEEARRCLLEVAVGNHRAIALYRKLGFSQLALRKAYYQRDNGHEDAVIMCRIL